MGQSSGKEKKITNHRSSSLKLFEISDKFVAKFL